MRTHLVDKLNIFTRVADTVQGDPGGESSLMCKEGCRFSIGWYMREPYCSLSSAVCNATIPSLPLSPFFYVLHYVSLRLVSKWPLQWS